jgi:hypothetical protein
MKFAYGARSASARAHREKPFGQVVDGALPHRQRGDELMIDGDGRQIVARLWRRASEEA